MRIPSSTRLLAAAVWAVVALLCIGCAPMGPVDGVPSRVLSETGESTEAAAPSPLPTPTPRPTASTDPSSTAATEAVEVVLASWTSDSVGVEASAYVSGLVESGGQCVLHAESQGTVLTAHRDAHPTGQNTSCGQLAVTPEDGLIEGSWQLWISYSSDLHFGESDAVDVQYPGSR